MDGSSDAAPKASGSETNVSFREVLTGIRDKVNAGKAVAVEENKSSSGDWFEKSLIFRMKTFEALLNIKAQHDWDDVDLSSHYVSVLVDHGKFIQDEVYLQWHDKRVKVWVSENPGDWIPEFNNEGYGGARQQDDRGSHMDSSEQNVGDEARGDEMEIIGNETEKNESSPASEQAGDDEPAELILEKGNKGGENYGNSIFNSNSNGEEDLSEDRVDSEVEKEFYSVDNNVLKSGGVGDFMEGKNLMEGELQGEDQQNGSHEVIIGADVAVRDEREPVMGIP
ncbi:hypothetical protein L1987_75681 [Smallanthus sonchifolius]|uniref:Uncharacterized protein n=1 Tax=Smallanthus sonchifolius TaxID=185202 RepID=A0ACB9A6N7_9ASTR|nr:hypothetical protein L1987_75681 [Smallanthus sonchifolius]